MFFCFGYPEFFPDILSVPDHGDWGLLQEDTGLFFVFLPCSSNSAMRIGKKKQT
jgi:hypothetical protein